MSPFELVIFTTDPTVVAAQPSPRALISVTRRSAMSSVLIDCTSSCDVCGIVYVPPAGGVTVAPINWPSYFAVIVRPATSAVRTLNRLVDQFGKYAMIAARSPVSISPVVGEASVTYETVDRK